jgi:hypothetical protein
MKYVYLGFGIMSAWLSIYFKSESLSIIGLICIATYSILDKINKNKSDENKEESQSIFNCELNGNFAQNKCNEQCNKCKRDVQ